MLIILWYLAYCCGWLRVQDETALSVDMGLMWAFDVDAHGFPTGCPGLHTFFPSSDRFSDFTCGIDGRPWFVNPSVSFNDPNLQRVTRNNWTERACPMDCPRNSYTYPGDTSSIADHFERFADDQARCLISPIHPLGPFSPALVFYLTDPPA